LLLVNFTDLPDFSCLLKDGLYCPNVNLVQLSKPSTGRAEAPPFKDNAVCRNIRRPLFTASELGSGDDRSSARSKLTLPHISIQILIFLSQLQLELLQSFLQRNNVILVGLLLLLEEHPFSLTLTKQFIELVARIFQLLLQRTGGEYFLAVLLLN
jgi:hypothetical protein